MKWLVCGGIYYEAEQYVRQCLDRLVEDFGKPVIIIEGGATGADRLAWRWATSHGICVATVPALWSIHGPAAGPIRNAAMLALSPTLVIAFPGGRGTANMIKQAEDANVRVLRQL
jgi:hypothetical protein